MTVSDDIRAFLERVAGEVERAASGPSPRVLHRAARRRARSVAVLSLVAALVASGVLVGVRALGRPSPVVPAAPAACTTWAIVPSPNLEPARFDMERDYSGPIRLRAGGGE